MSYQNPQIPEGINVTAEHPLKDFFFMLLGVTGIGLALLVVLLVLAEWLVQFIPFETEQALVEQDWFESAIPGATTDNSDSTDNTDNSNRDGANTHRETEQYLNQLAQALLQKTPPPEGIEVVVHYIDSDTVNAFATLGGHIVVFRGLLDALPNENAVAMLLAHEIAHIKHRDPIIAAGRGLTVGLALASIVGASDNSLVHSLLGQMNFLTAMAFSRDQEQQADDDALASVLAYYGHVNGADGVFIALEEHSFSPPAFLSSHPVTADRISNVHYFQQQYASSIPVVPKPVFNTDKQ